ncbi:hypothetical protein F5Y15DRAFT_331746 [Xylariaceae sp. FL0016]|nr:hypothetical protein F5Y15DRAFT_331746 [Xylariaceae sp. FL0016]
MSTNGVVKHDELPVLVIGAGVSGLAIAHGLHLNNIPYRLFERDDHLTSRSTRDWALACHWSLPHLATLLGEEKWSRIASAQIDPSLAPKDAEVVKVINGATGDVENGVRFENLRRFLRSRLRSLIAEGLRVEYGKKLERITYSEANGEAGGVRIVTAYFADGESVKGRLLIGADGSHSRVRNLLLGAEKARLRRLPFAATFINASFSREQALYLRSFHPIINIIVHPENMVGMLGTLDAASPDPEQWGFTFYISWKASVEEQDAESNVMDVRERLAQAKEMSRSWGEPLRSCHEWTNDDHNKVYYGGLANWDPAEEDHRWDNHGGLVTLMGDAAHPMTYHRGQGLNHALADAAKLVALLSGASEPRPQSQGELIVDYEAEMIARGGEEVRLSEMNSFMLHDFSKVEQSPLMKRGLAFHGDKGAKPATVVPKATTNGTAMVETAVQSAAAL